MGKEIPGDWDSYTFFFFGLLLFYFSRGILGKGWNVGEDGL